MNPAEEGVIRALRFWVMLSSMEDREMRRKSRNAIVEKQNCGVRFGGGEASVMMS